MGGVEGESIHIMISSTAMERSGTASMVTPRVADNVVASASRSDVTTVSATLSSLVTSLASTTMLAAVTFKMTSITFGKAARMRTLKASESKLVTSPATVNSAVTTGLRENPGRAGG